MLTCDQYFNEDCDLVGFYCNTLSNHLFGGININEQFVLCLKAGDI